MKDKLFIDVIIVIWCIRKQHKVEGNDSHLPVE